MSAEIFAYSDLAGLDFSDPFLMVIAIVYGIFLLIGLAVAVTAYIFQSLGVYTIAKRRGIHHPGLAWVPVANMWILGSISDQYQYVVKGKVRNRRKVLLGLMIAVYALLLVYLVMFFAGIFSADVTTTDPFNTSMIISMGGSIAVALVMSVISVIAAVFLYIAYYDLFRSCNPGNAVLFLVLAIFLDFLLPIFIFICRKKDEGMPPRRIQVPVAPWSPVTDAPAVPVVNIVDAPAEEPIPQEETAPEEPETEE